MRPVRVVSLLRVEVKLRPGGIDQPAVVNVRYRRNADPLLGVATGIVLPLAETPNNRFRLTFPAVQSIGRMKKSEFV